MKRLIIIALAVFGMAFVSTKAFAVHAGAGDLTCGSCHTMHSSQGGTNSPSMGGATGSIVLLKVDVGSRANVHLLCLDCHAQSGSNAGTVYNSGSWATTAPKVYLNTTWTGGDLKAVGAGGDFHGSGTYSAGAWTPDGSSAGLGRGHSLGATTVAPPGNSTTGVATGTTIAELTCITCHDPHGTASTTNAINRYRNLKAGSAMPAGAQNKWTDMSIFGNLAGSYVGAVFGSASGGVDTTGASTCATGGTTNCIWPIYKTTPTSNVYYERNTTVTLNAVNLLTGSDNSTVVGFSAFCSQCHGAWHEEVYTGNESAPDWKRHPVNNRMIDASEASGDGVSIVDIAHYGQTYGNLAAGRKLPTATAAAGTLYYDTDTTAATAGKVFCLSCHFPHASGYYDALRWEYTSSVSSGNQIGTGVPSDTGCQQCHNRGGTWGS